MFIYKVDFIDEDSTNYEIVTEYGIAPDDGTYESCSRFLSSYYGNENILSTRIARLTEGFEPIVVSKEYITQLLAYIEAEDLGKDIIC